MNQHQSGPTQPPSYMPYPPGPAFTPPAPKRSRTPWIIAGAVLAFFILAALLVLPRVFGAVKGVKANTDKVAEQVLGHMRTGDYETVWAESSEIFKETTPPEQWNAFLKGVETSVGKPISWRLQGVHTQTNLAGLGSRIINTFTYRVTHEHGSSTATIRVGGDLRLLRIDFNFSR